MRPKITFVGFGFANINDLTALVLTEEKLFVALSSPLSAMFSFKAFILILKTAKCALGRQL